MPVSIHPFRRFHVHCSVTYHAGTFFKLQLAYISGFGTSHKDLKQGGSIKSVGLPSPSRSYFLLVCPFSKASFMHLSTASIQRTTNPWMGGQGDTPMATILVIDDQEPVRSLLRLVLEGAGHDVLEASNGRLGLELYQKRSADLIITDIFMPEMNGLELMLELTRNFLNVKVIAMSGGLEGEGALTAAKLLGARQTFQKPLDVEELLSAVRYDLAH